MKSEKHTLWRPALQAFTGIFEEREPVNGVFATTSTLSPEE